MADEQQQSRPGFKHTVVKKALAPLVATAATAATTYLMRKAVELWHETVQPKLEEKGGPEAIARDAADAVSNKLAPVSEAVTSKVGGDEPETKQEPAEDAGRGEERRKREQRRKQRAKALDQARTS
jgi:hypothetical protein